MSGSFSAASLHARAASLPDAGRQPHVFATNAWLRAWERTTIERTLATRYAWLENPARAVPYYHLASSPFWTAYETEASVGPVWPGPVICSPTAYAIYGGGLSAPDDIDAAVDEGLTAAANLGAGAVVFVNVEDDEAQPWMEHRPPTEALVLDLAHRSPLATSLEDQLAGLRSHVRRELRRQWRRARERGVSLVVLRGPEMRPRLVEFARLASATSQRHSGDLYDLATFEAVADIPAATLLLAEADGQALGAFLCFAHEERFYLWTAGIAYEALREYGTYAFLMVESITHAIRDGHTVIEAGRGNSAFKVRHGFDATKLWALVYLGEEWDADRALRRRLAEMRDGLLDHLGLA